MNQGEANQSRLNQIQIAAVIVGLVGLAAALAGAFLGTTARFFQSYLFAYMFWIGLSLGSLAILMLHHVVGGRWGWLIRSIVEAGTRTLWIMPILFIPLLLGMNHLYIWTQPEVVAASEVLQRKSAYLNIPFFIIRLIIYFAIWILLTVLFNRWGKRANDLSDQNRWFRSPGLGAVGLIIYILTMTFAATDWVMSIEPLWVSSGYGLVVIMAQALAALAFALVVLPLVSRIWTSASLPSPTPLSYKDLGTLLLVMVMGWAYLAFFQFLVIWGGNIPREVVWYLNRTQGGWLYVGILVFALQVVIPFMALITQQAKRSVIILAFLGLMIVSVTLLNYFWQVIPAFSPGIFNIHWLDIALPIGLGGLWIAAFIFALKRRPPLPYVEPGR